MMIVETYDADAGGKSGNHAVSVGCKVGLLMDTILKNICFDDASRMQCNILLNCAIQIPLLN